MSSKIVTKYNYQKYITNKVNNLRYYCLSEDLNVPSVTSILRSTSLINSKFSGKITDSMEIGDMMHQFLENYISGIDVVDNYLGKTSNTEIASSLAKLVIDNLIMNLDEIWGSEVSVHYKDQYAGTIDLIAIIDGKISIIDYKSSYRTKTLHELKDFFLQCAAYAIAHDWQYGTTIDSIMIFQVTRGGDFEQNVISNPELENYKEMWFQRLNEFNVKITSHEGRS